MVTVDRRLWLNADRSTVVEDGDPAAAFLWATPGDEVDDEHATQVGYKARRTAEVKPVEPAEDKADTPAENKVSGLTVNRRKAKE